MTGVLPDDEDRPEDKPETKAEPFLSSFTRADRKLFVITFAGTVAANVITVMIVAVAVVFVRGPGTTHEQPVPRGLVPTALFVCLAVAVLSIGAAWVRKHWFASDPFFRVMVWLLWLGAACLILIFVLILLGYAAGVK